MRIPRAWFEGLPRLARLAFSGRSRGGSPGGYVLGSGQTVCTHTVRSLRGAVFSSGPGDDSGQYAGGIPSLHCLCPGTSEHPLETGIVPGPGSETLHPPGQFCRQLFSQSPGYAISKFTCLQQIGCWTKRWRFAKVTGSAL